MSSTFKNVVTASVAGLLLSGAALVGTSATAAASPVASPAAAQSSVQPARPPHWCPGGKHWRSRWFDNHGWWDGHHRWQRGRWNNDGCY
jgi:Spy/CpxP family protein refolding chaperone